MTNGASAAATAVIITRRTTPTFKFTLTDDNGDPIDLTSITRIAFGAKRKEDFEDDDDSDSIFEVACTVDSPATAGICRATLSVADTELTGVYIAEVKGDFGSGTTITTFTQFILTIRSTVVHTV